MALWILLAFLLLAWVLWFTASAAQIVMSEARRGFPEVIAYQGGERRRS
jgi:hypothetical protein